MDKHADKHDEMGCCPCKEETSEWDDKPQGEKPGGEKQFSNPLTYQWEQDLVDNLMTTKRITKAAIVGLQDHALRAWAPPDFIPENQCLKDLIAAFEGDISGLVEHCIVLGGNTNVFVPGKLNPKSLYGTDGKGNGVAIYLTNTALLILVYEGRQNSDAAATIGVEAADHMRDNDR